MFNYSVKKLTRKNIYSFLMDFYETRQGNSDVIFQDNYDSSILLGFKYTTHEFIKPTGDKQLDESTSFLVFIDEDSDTIAAIISWQDNLVSELNYIDLNSRYNFSGIIQLFINDFADELNNNYLLYSQNVSVMSPSEIQKALEESLNTKNKSLITDNNKGLIYSLLKQNKISQFRNLVNTSKD